MMTAHVAEECNGHTTGLSLCEGIILRSNSIVRDITPKGGDVRWVLLAVHVMGATKPDVFQPGTLRWFGKTHGPILMVLPVSRPQSIRLLALRMRVLLSVGLFGDWFEDGVLCLVAIYMASLVSPGPNTSSQLNQND
ncbi:hypothetical protein TNCV_4331891 [Trichonephila clavipes]|nr:hypothetical protein TNCV_4331891 [Trichonephila clavipes]